MATVREWRVSDESLQHNSPKRRNGIVGEVEKRRKQQRKNILARGLVNRE